MLRHIAIIILASSCVLTQVMSMKKSITVAQGIGLKRTKFEPGELIFEDTFETFDSSVWVHEPNNPAHINEFQLNTDSIENCYSQDGILHIKPTLFNESVISENLQSRIEKTEFFRDPFHAIRSARISTRNSFSFLYGTLEIKARTPAGDWLFPALWLMPRDAAYGPWPVSGEIDLMESRGNKQLTDSDGNLVGAQSVCSTLHWGPNKELNRWNLTHFTKENDSCYSSDFHVYKLIWTPDSIIYFIDGEEIGSVTPPSGGFWEMGNFTNDNVTNPWEGETKSAPFDREFYVIMNLAVGGLAFFSDTYINEGGKPWENTSPNAGLDFWNGRDQWLPTWHLPSEDSHFLIDYVRVWAL